MENFQNKSTRPLTFVIIVMIILFILFSGGALLVTLENDGMMGRGWGSGISWMWIPALLFLTLGLILSWVKKSMKKEEY